MRGRKERDGEERKKMEGRGRGGRKGRKDEGRKIDGCKRTQRKV